LYRSRTSLEVDGLKIIGEVYSPSKGTTYPALCLCHGIPRGEPRDHNDGGYPSFAEEFCAQGFIVMIFNFRGSGLSEGNFDMLGWTRDLEASLDYLYNFDGVDKDHISVIGFSGGAMVSIYVTSKDTRVSSLVSCSCPIKIFDSANREWLEAFIERQRTISISGGHSPCLSPEELTQGFEKIRPLKWIDKISPRPLLIIHGENDEVAAPSQALELYKQAGSPKELVMVKGAKHRLRTNEYAMSAVLNWLKRINE